MAFFSRITFRRQETAGETELMAIEEGRSLGTPIRDNKHLSFEGARNAVEGTPPDSRVDRKPVRMAVENHPLLHHESRGSEQRACIPNIEQPAGPSSLMHIEGLNPSRNSEEPPFIEQMDTSAIALPEGTRNQHTYLRGTGKARLAGKIDPMGSQAQVS